MVYKKGVKVFRRGSLEAGISPIGRGRYYVWSNKAIGIKKKIWTSRSKAIRYLKSKMKK